MNMTFRHISLGKSGKKFLEPRDKASVNNIYPYSGRAVHRAQCCFVVCVEELFAGEGEYNDTENFEGRQTYRIKEEDSSGVKTSVTIKSLQGGAAPTRRITPKCPTLNRKDSFATRHNLNISQNDKLSTPNITMKKSIAAEIMKTINERNDNNVIKSLTFSGWKLQGRTTFV